MIAKINADIIACRRCPRLVQHRETVPPRRGYADQKYWRKPVPGFGDPAARLWIIGLAPGAHGANRTGRVFTGDRSGDFLFAALHRGGWANQPASNSIDDGLQLTDCYISASARCVPPDNRPTPVELKTCSRFLDREWNALTHKRVLLALGGIAWSAVLRHLDRPGPVFGHGVEMALSPDLTLVGSYHVSQQNTFTGRLTIAMFDAVLARCLALCDKSPTG
jgi:uracil-DNA glycosylase family 4